LVCLYNFDQACCKANQFSNQSIGHARELFLLESVQDIQNQLAELGQQLVIRNEYNVTALSEIIDAAQVTDVFRSDNAGWYENQAWQQLAEAFPSCRFHSTSSHTLFSRESLPFDVNQLPVSFSKFRAVIENIRPSAPIKKITFLPRPVQVKIKSDLLPSIERSTDTQFKGGESAGLEHLSRFFNSQYPLRYKEVRNSLDGWNNSCKLSPWLANGNVSVREVLSELHAYENTYKANDSTYWIFFELLWREYFHWYALKHGSKLFAFKGITQHKPMNSYYAERFTKWIKGSTPYPIVNACMRELAKTGYLSNRGRQIVASCFVNELSLDWRYGADYFEKNLIDYDVASNWGNWQYLAGVGADQRGKRHFNLQKQTALFDPEQHYIKKWSGTQLNPNLDSVDAADWPIT
jgi:deoxyribodipyrimidine photo-lyase